MPIKWLGDYGEFIAAYDGMGSLILSGGRTLPCRFEAGQTAQGRCVLLCDFDLSEETIVLEADARGLDGFTGMTEDRLQFRTIGLLQMDSGRYEPNEGYNSIVMRPR